MKPKSRHYTPVGEIPADGTHLYVICADDRTIAVYRVKVQGGALVPAPDTEHPDIYTPGIEDGYQMHGLYTVEGSEDDDGKG